MSDKIYIIILLIFILIIIYLLDYNEYFETNNENESQQIISNSEYNGSFLNSSNPYNNSIYNLIYIGLDGSINIINQNTWINQSAQSAFDANKNIIRSYKNFPVSKITQLNTGEFLFLGSDCSVYKVGYNFINPTLVSDLKFTSLTQLSNYKILLTSKDGKMYVVDDINNFDETIVPFFDDSIQYCSIKQTFDGLVVAIDGTKCGNAYSFELKKNQLLNKKKLNLDEAFTNRVTLFTPDQINLINLNCDPRYKNYVYKFIFSDKKFESSNDTKCLNGQEYESFNKKCYNLCPPGYKSNPDDIISCWEKCKPGQIDTGAFCMDSCKPGYKNIAGVCWLDQILTYDRGIGILPDYSCPDGYDLEGVRCIKNPPDGYNRLQGDYTTYWLKDSTSYIKKSKEARQDNSACDGLSAKTTTIGSCSGWDECNSKIPITCTKLCNSCTYDNYTWGCNSDRCGNNPEVCAGGDCLPVTTGGECTTVGCACSKQFVDKKCPDGFTSDGTTCWKKCLPGQIDNGAFCMESCKPGYKNIAGVCWLDQTLTYDRGIGILPDYSCPAGYDLVGTKCIKKPPNGYNRLKGDYTTYWLKDSTSYVKDSKEARQDNSACDGLSAKTTTIGSCSGWDECNSKIPITCTKLCNSCTYDNYTWGCNSDRCGNNPEVCAGGDCLPVTTGGECTTIGCACSKQLVDKKCPDGFTSDGTTCWENCKSGQIDTGAFCMESCKPGYKNIAGVCWLDQTLTYDRGIGILPDYSCPEGYDLEGTKCILKPPDGYKRLQGDYTTYWLKDSTSYVKDSKEARQDNSACDGLSAKTTTVGSCSGWDDCNSKNPITCTKLCKSCTYDNYTWGCNSDRCGNNPEVCAGGNCLPVTTGGECKTTGCGCPKGKPKKGSCKSKDVFGTCWEYRYSCPDGQRSDGVTCWEDAVSKCEPLETDLCGARSARTCTTTAKCCDNGIKTTLTGINCAKCGTYDSCTGGECLGAVVTRNAPRSCPSGYNFDSGDPLKVGLCYENCRDGYESKDGDIISCWNKKATSITIPSSNIINATPSCKSNRGLEDGLCYVSCDSGYVGVAANCSIPTNKSSYVPISTAKKTKPVDKSCPPGLRNDGTNCFEDAVTTCKPFETDKCGARSARTCTTTAKCCDNGIKTTLTGINCAKCGTYDSCTGGGCLGAVVSRNAPRSCPSGYNFDSGDPLKVGLCYENCRDGYESKDGDLISCWNKKATSITIPTSDIINATKSCKSNRGLQDDLCYESCDSGYIGTATNCSIPANKASYVPISTAKETKPVDKSCPPGLRNDGINCFEDAVTTCKPLETDKCGARSARTCTTTAKCCDNGIKTTLTGINCAKCGTYDSCTGGECMGAVVSRNAPRSCPSGYSFDSMDPLKVGLCYENCRDGYESKDGDLISCWNKKPTSITIPTSSNIASTPSCKSNRGLQDGLCYESCRDGYIGAATNCSIPANKASYVPTSTPKNTKSRGLAYDLVSASEITCDSDCCMFDLTFYNPLYAKPINIVLPINLPVVEGLVGFYDASSFQNNIWYDSSSSNNNAVYTKGTFNNNGNFISGTTSSSILFPIQILPREYTVFNIAKYNGSAKGKILCGYLNNWFSGFANGLSGVAGRNQPITQTTLSAFDDNWVFSLDTKTTYGANGAYYNTLTSTDSRTQLSVNLNDDPKSNSDFSIGCIIVFDRILDNNEILSMQTWLTTKYADLYSSTYTKTFAQLGYSCFDNKIGKVTNNYNNYTYASYKNGTLDCEWLNLPEKKDFNGLVCVETNSEKYETFDNLSGESDKSDYYLWDYIFGFLIIILIIVIIYKKKYKN